LDLTIVLADLCQSSRLPRLDESAAMAKSSFIYASYIRTTLEDLWDALVNPEKTRMYWFDSRLESDWTVGSSWQFLSPDGRVVNSGQVLENTPPTRLALSWRNELKPQLRAEGFSQLVFDSEQQGDLVKLTLSQEIDRSTSALIDDVASGWPIVLSSLKSLLETGASFEMTGNWPKGL
jgi:uncharacterized protein YndB with AHSA1/START domain